MAYRLGNIDEPLECQAERRCDKSFEVNECGHTKYESKGHNDKGAEWDSHKVGQCAEEGNVAKPATRVEMRLAPSHRQAVLRIFSE